MVTVTWKHSTIPRCIQTVTEFVISTSNNIENMPWNDWLFQKRSEVKITVTPKWCATLCHFKMHPHIKFIIPTSNNVEDMLQTWLFLKEVRSKDHDPSDPKIVRNTLPSQDVFTQSPSLWFLPQITWKLCPGTIILETRSDVKITVTKIWFATLRHPQMHTHSKFVIPTSNNVWDMLQKWLFKASGMINFTKRFLNFVANNMF